MRLSARLASYPWPRLLFSAASLFFVLASNYMLRPIRDALGISGGLAELPWLYTATLVSMIVAQGIYGALVVRVPRRWFIPLMMGFFIIQLLLFWYWLGRGKLDGGTMPARAFFVWASVFNLFAVTMCWGLVADVFSHEEGLHYFGFIAAGATLGALAGSGLTTLLARPIGPLAMMLVASVSLVFALVCLVVLERMATERGSPDLVVPVPARSTGGVLGGAVAGVAHVARSRYLQWICLYLLLFTLTSTIAYFEQARIVKAQIKDVTEKTVLLANIDLAANCIGLVGQLLLAGRLMRWVGVGPTLAVLPILSLAGFLALGGAPLLWVLAPFLAIRRGLDFGITKPAREVLFTVVPREDKYHAKSFIDTFVYRGGDLVGAWAFTALSTRMSGLLRGCLTAVVCVGWMAVGIVIGRTLARRRAKAAAAATTATATTTTATATTVE